MRAIIDPRLTAGRVRHGIFASPDSWGHAGIFYVQGPCGQMLKIVASDATIPEAMGWEHVSVSKDRNPPNWEEMCFVKDLFWDPEETAFQLHPPRSQWVNNHARCLHLWRHINQDPPMPPQSFVGAPELGCLHG